MGLQRGRRGRIDTRSRRPAPAGGCRRGVRSDSHAGSDRSRGFRFARTLGNARAANRSSPSRLREELSGRSNLFVTDDRFHQREHAVEVELPLIQTAWPEARILPVEVPPEPVAVEIGIAVARAIAAAGLSAVYLASSDMTHYGPNYRFTPAGIGQAALEWAMGNDRRILRIVTDMTPEKIVPEVRMRFNACGGGAIAAMMSACLEQGARKAIVLGHTNSYQTLAAVAPQSAENAVGYAAVWVG